MKKRVQSNKSTRRAKALEDYRRSRGNACLSFLVVLHAVHEAVHFGRLSSLLDNRISEFLSQQKKKEEEEEN